MNINIFRCRFTPWSVDGSQWLGGKIFCDARDIVIVYQQDVIKFSFLPSKKEVSETRRKANMKNEIVNKPPVRSITCLICLGAELTLSTLAAVRYV